MHLSNKGKLFKTRALRLEIIVETLIAGITAKIAFILVIVINAEITKTETSFLVSGVANI